MDLKLLATVFGSVLLAELGVLAGGAVSQYASPAMLKYAAGAGFIGIWTLLRT